jgi:nitroimidazol reductase NimA-like FMN-containing flavoprotein (pyridoxamine 5'-phosphate oxidase superfamily)
LQSRSSHGDVFKLTGEVARRSVSFTKAEKNFLKQNEACRIGTLYLDEPYVTPISYIFEEENNTDSVFYFATDYDPRKYKNLKRNRKVALAIDVYHSSVDNKAVIIQGEVVDISSPPLLPPTNSILFVVRLTCVQDILHFP